MPPDFSLSEQLKKVPSNVRPIVNAALNTVKEAAPEADEIAYRSQPPSSKSAMWKLARYAVNGANVVGVGTFTDHSTIFFIADGSSTMAAACCRAAARTRGS